MPETVRSKTREEGNRVRFFADENKRTHRDNNKEYGPTGREINPRLSNNPLNAKISARKKTPPRPYLENKHAERFSKKHGLTYDKDDGNQSLRAKSIMK